MSVLAAEMPASIVAIEAAVDNSATHDGKVPVRESAPAGYNSDRSSLQCALYLVLPRHRDTTFLFCEKMQRGAIGGRFASLPLCRSAVRK